jgi:hypothetical protein
MHEGLPRTMSTASSSVRLDVIRDCSHKTLEFAGHSERDVMLAVVMAICALEASLTMES